MCGKTVTICSGTGSLDVDTLTALSDLQGPYHDDHETLSSGILVIQQRASLPGLADILTMSSSIPIVSSAGSYLRDVQTSRVMYADFLILQIHENFRITLLTSVPLCCFLHYSRGFARDDRRSSKGHTAHKYDRSVCEKFTRSATTIG
jgi:hypothetical protein